MKLAPLLKIFSVIYKMVIVLQCNNAKLPTCEITPLQKCYTRTYLLTERWPSTFISNRYSGLNVKGCPQVKFGTGHCGASKFHYTRYQPVRASKKIVISVHAAKWAIHALVLIQIGTYYDGQVAIKVAVKVWYNIPGRRCSSIQRV